MIRDTAWLAWRLLSHERIRLAGSFAGLVGAVVLMCMELGFLNAMVDSHVVLLSKLRGELFVVSTGTRTLTAVTPFSRHRLQQARSVEGVETTYPVYLDGRSFGLRDPASGRRRVVRVVAVNPDDPVFAAADLQLIRERLRERGAVLFDARSKPHVGQLEIGDLSELGRRRVHVVGEFDLGPDLLNDGTVVISDDDYLDFARATPGRARQSAVSLGVVLLESGASVEEAQGGLREALPEDVRVLQRRELVERERGYWRDNTVVGFVFGLAMLVAFLVGAVVCYQILSVNVLDRLPQFATMRAMGHSDRFLVATVGWQAALLGGLSALLGVMIAAPLYAAVEATTGLPMTLTAHRVALICGLTLLMCALAAMVTVRRVLIADPADVFD